VGGGQMILFFKFVFKSDMFFFSKRFFNK
jgi:hypothetical protein